MLVAIPARAKSRVDHLLGLVDDLEVQIPSQCHVSFLPRQMLTKPKK